MSTERCKHGLLTAQCATCTNPTAIAELDRMSRTAMATDGYHDLRKDER